MHETGTIPDEEARTTDRVSWGRWVRLACLLASGLMCAAMAVCYAVRPDPFATITVFPAWAWAVPGLALISLARRGERPRAGVLLMVAWATFVLTSAEEPWSLARALTQPPGPTRGGMALRVVTLNCNVGDVRAAGEVAALLPDIVLLQESPNRAEVAALAHRLFGAEAGFVHGVDASVIARGSVVAQPFPAQRGAMVRALVTMPGGRQVQVISARLLPAVFRLDLWSPDCWEEQAENRRLRRAQLSAIAASMQAAPTPVILGGDFNAPQGDAVFDLLRPRLNDTFAAAGRGWGNTITDGFPVLRIDQVWVSGEFLSRSVAAKATRHSDHRMVVCDLVLQASPVAR